MGPSWRRLGAILGRLEAILGRLGAIWRPSWGHHGRKMAAERVKMMGDGRLKTQIAEMLKNATLPRKMLILGVKMRPR